MNEYLNKMCNDLTCPRGWLIIPIRIDGPYLVCVTTSKDGKISTVLRKPEQLTILDDTDFFVTCPQCGSKTQAIIGLGKGAIISCGICDWDKDVTDIFNEAIELGQWQGGK